MLNRDTRFGQYGPILLISIFDTKVSKKELISSSRHLLLYPGRVQFFNYSIKFTARPLKKCFYPPSFPPTSTCFFPIASRKYVGVNPQMNLLKLRTTPCIHSVSSLETNKKCPNFRVFLFLSSLNLQSNNAIEAMGGTKKERRRFINLTVFCRWLFWEAYISLARPPPQTELCFWIVQLFYLQGMGNQSNLSKIKEVLMVIHEKGFWLKRGHKTSQRLVDPSFLLGFCKFLDVTKFEIQTLKRSVESSMHTFLCCQTHIFLNLPFFPDLLTLLFRILTLPVSCQIKTKGDELSDTSSD